VVVGMVLWGLTLQPAWAGTRTISVTGTVDDPQATVKVNGTPATVTDGSFSASVTLNEGSNTITATATDAAGNSTPVSVRVTLDTVAPVITISSPSDSQVFGAQ